MPTPLSGHLETRLLADGHRAFYAKIRTDRHVLGREPEWTKDRAERFLNATLLPAAKLRQAWWDLIPSSAAVPGPTQSLTVWQACSEYVQWRETRSENRNTRSAVTSPVVKHLLPFFAFVDVGQTIQRSLSDIDEGLVARFIERKRQERAILADLAEKLADASAQELQDLERLTSSESVDLDEDEVVLLRRYGQRGGCHKLSDPGARGRISLSSRGLKDAEINRCLSTLRSVVDRANRRHGLQIPDPTLDMRLRGDPPNRNWLWPEHVEALIAAARTLDEREGRYAHNGREAAIWVLALCGPRVHEFCGFNWRDLSDAGLTVRKSKTDAGRRAIQVPTVARAALAAHRARLGDPGADTPIWPTSTGRRRDRNNVRARLLAPVTGAARAALERSGGEPLPERVTPHTFRRTAATSWYWLGRDERTTMYEIGHRSSRLTLEVYAQPRPRDPNQKQVLEAWMAGVEI
ncbi:MAG TPA: site-specific integrase [Solirubrobacteraceae bacterium]|nr:site-specific integrase [Solirubrobacteraceae bacterium]